MQLLQRPARAEQRRGVGQEVPVGHQAQEAVGPRLDVGGEIEDALRRGEVQRDAAKQVDRLGLGLEVAKAQHVLGALAERGAIRRIVQAQRARDRHFGSPIHVHR